MKLGINAFPDTHTKIASISMGTNTSVCEKEMYPLVHPESSSYSPLEQRAGVGEVRSTASLALSICSHLTKKICLLINCPEIK